MVSFIHSCQCDGWISIKHCGIIILWQWLREENIRTSKSPQIENKVECKCQESADIAFSNMREWFEDFWAERGEKAGATGLVSDFLSLCALFYSSWVLEEKFCGN